MVSRNLKIKYRRSIFGMLWTLMTPMAMTTVYYFVFKVILNVQIPHQAVFFLSGVLPWSFINQTILEGMESIVASFGLISKVPVPLQVFPLVNTITNFVTFIFALPVLFGIALLDQVPVTASWLMLIPLFGAIALISYGLCLTLAIFFVKLRDLRHLMGIGLQVLFYTTPVIYDEQMIPEKFRWILFANPFGVAFSDIHTAFIYGRFPPVDHLVITGLWTFAALGAAILTYKKLGTGLVEQI